MTTARGREGQLRPFRQWCRMEGKFGKIRSDGMLAVESIRFTNARDPAAYRLLLLLPSFWLR